MVNNKDPDFELVFYIAMYNQTIFMIGRDHVVERLSI